MRSRAEVGRLDLNIVPIVEAPDETTMGRQGLKPPHGIAARPRFPVRPERGTRRCASLLSACRIRSITPLTVSPAKLGR